MIAEVVHPARLFRGCRPGKCCEAENLAVPLSTRHVIPEPGNDPLAGDDVYNSTRKDMIRADLTRRLRNACAHLTDAEFRHLVEVMVERQLKGERRRNLE